MSRNFYFVTLLMSVVIGVIVFFMKDSLSTMALLGVLFITSMISITSVHGIIVHSVDIKKNVKFSISFINGCCLC